ncbi:MAG: arsenate reductase/protein-tyrosine-phosphatase family protein [Sulfobacillus sp.]
MATEEQRILFVCTGNTCRSAMAQALWNQLYREPKASSAGISAWSGQTAQQSAQNAIRAYGADLAHHRSRDLDDVWEEPEWVICMTRAQCQGVAERRPQWAQKTYLLSELVGESGDIADPIGLDQVVYDKLASVLYGLLRRLGDRLGGVAAKDDGEG